MLRNLLKKNKILLVLFFAGAFVLSAPFSRAAITCGSGYISDPGTGVCVKRDTGGAGLLHAQSLPELISKIVTILLAFGGTIAVVFIIIGGYKYITSQGNEKAAESGRNTLVNAVIGLVVIIFAYAIVRLVNVFVTR